MGRACMRTAAAISTVGNLSAVNWQVAISLSIPLFFFFSDDDDDMIRRTRSDPNGSKSGASDGRMGGNLGMLKL